MGRPTKRSLINKAISEGMREKSKQEEKIAMLKEAAAVDASVTEMCYYANISVDTYYRWMKEKPELSEEIKRLRNKPVLKARHTIIASLGNVSTAQWYIERKRADEFSTKTKVEHSGAISDDPAFSEKEEAIAEKYEQEIDATIKNQVTEKMHGDAETQDTDTAPVPEAPQARSATNGSPAESGD